MNREIDKRRIFRSGRDDHGTSIPSLPGRCSVFSFRCSDRARRNENEECPGYRPDLPRLKICCRIFSGQSHCITKVVLLSAV